MKLLVFILSFLIVGFGQPSWSPLAGIAASAFGYGAFWHFCRQYPSIKQRFAIALFWYSAVQAVQLSWMTSIKYQGLSFLLLYGLVLAVFGVQFSLASLFIPQKGKLRWIECLAIASIWVVMEWARLHVLCGFSWNFSGMSLTSTLASLQFASVIGLLGFSFWVFLTNLLFLNIWEKKGKVKHATIWALIAVFPYIFGAVRLGLYENSLGQETKNVSITLVQTDLLPSQKIPLDEFKYDFVPPLDQWKNIFRILQKKEGRHSDLIVMPEATVPYRLDFPIYQYEEARTLFCNFYGKQIVRSFPPPHWPYVSIRDVDGSDKLFVTNAFFSQTLANYYQSEMIIGLDYEESELQKQYNSAFHFVPGAAFQNRYDKQVLVPLGEYLPFEWCRPIAKVFGINDFFHKGTEQVLFRGKVPMAISICYEETFSSVMRNSRNLGALLFINLTNDSWYPDSTLFREHLDHAKIRAVENGITLARACNGGVSAVIDPFGRTLVELEKAQGMVEVDMKIFSILSPYRFYGDWLVLGFAFILIVMFGRKLIFIDQVKKKLNFKLYTQIK